MTLAIATLLPLLSLVLIPALVQTAPASPVDVALQSFFNFLAAQFVPIIFSILGLLLAPVILKLRNYVASKLSTDQLAQLQAYIHIAVLAAEQAGLDKAVVAAGKDKKATVVASVQQWLNLHNLSGIDAKLIDTIIEGAVYDEFNRFRELSNATAITSTTDSPLK